jgi:hypothetical protein
MTHAARNGRRWRRVALAALSGVLAAAAAYGADAAPAAELLPQPVRDLHYGDVLFHYYQDDYFESIVRLEVAKDFGLLPHQAAEAELLAGGLYLSLGLHGEASRIFERLLAGPVPQSVSDRAHFYLARIGYQRGYLAEAWSSLERIRGQLPGDLEVERRLLSANVLMEQGRFGEAANALRNWNDESLASRYGRFNLGVALIRSGESAHGTVLLEDLGTRDAATEEERALRDRANLALGFASLQQHAPDVAVAALSRVRLDGPFTSRALLGLGWAESDAQRPERALVPWLELRNHKLLDASVQESYLAVPYAYAQLASNAEAAVHYRSAVDAYGAEVRRIDESIAVIGRGGFLDAILDAAPDERQAGWFWELERLPDAPQTRYLYHLLATHEFQEGLKNYRDLRIMRRNLARWQLSLEAFDGMIAARERAAAERTPRKDEMLATVDIESLAQRCGELDTRIAGIEQGRDVHALADADESRQLATLQRIDAALQALPAGPQRDALMERARLLRGTLLWSLDARYKRSLTSLKRELKLTHAQLAQARERVELVKAAAPQAQLDTAGYAARAAELAKRIRTIQPGLDAAAAAQEKVLARIAIAELELQKRRLGSYASQAQYALAAIYDHAAAGGGR